MSEEALDPALCDEELESPEEPDEDSDTYELEESLVEPLDDASPAEPSLLEEAEATGFVVLGAVVFLVVGFFVDDDELPLDESLDEVVVFFFFVDVLLDLEESLLDEDEDEDFFFVVELELSSELPESSEPDELSLSDVVNIAGHSVVPLGHSPSS